MERQMIRPETSLDPRYSGKDAVASSWDDAAAALEAAELFWLTTIRADGRPHSTPLVAVWVDDALHFTTGEHEQKARNLRAHSRVLLSTGRLDWQAGMDIVVEGDAFIQTDQHLLERLGEAWRKKWDGRWQYEARDGRFFHPGDFEVIPFSVAPETVLVISEGAFAQTTHRFPRS
jgi:general stress protein 26